jgi:glycosyltransferase involved in cell wall biosynthesis
MSAQVRVVSRTDNVAGVKLPVFNQYDTGAEQLVFHHFLWLGLNSLRDALALPGRRGLLVLHEFLAQCHHHGQMITATTHLPCSSATPSRCGNCFPTLGRPRFELRRRLVGEVFDQLDGFVSPSRFLAERYVAWGLPAERVHVVENGLLHPGQPAPPRPAAGRFVFGFFGQLNPFKGVDVLLGAAERLASAAEIEIRIHGNIIGLPEALVARLDRLAESLPQLRFMGAYENDQVGALMAECDYVLVPSIWWENSPVVIQEAYAAGRPVICTGIGGMAEKVVPGVTGLHFRRNDAGDLAQVMQSAADPALLAKLQAGLPRPADAPTMARNYLAAMGLPTAAAEAEEPQAARKPRRACGPFLLTRHQHGLIGISGRRRLHMRDHRAHFGPEGGQITKACGINHKGQPAIHDAAILQVMRRGGDAADQRTGQDFAHQRQPIALMPTKRQQGAARLVPIQHTRIIGGLPLRIHQSAIWHWLAGIEGNATFAKCDGRRGKIQDQRVFTFRHRRHGNADRVGGHAPIGPPKGRHRAGAGYAIDEMD